MHPPEPDPTPRRNTDGAAGGSALPGLTLQAFQPRSQHRHVLHPVEAALQYHRAQAEIPGEEGHGGYGFEEAEAHYRAGAQGLRLSEIPQFPQQLRELSRFSVVDRAGRKALREWAQNADLIIDEAEFLSRWQEQVKPGGAEHDNTHPSDFLSEYPQNARYT